MFSTNSPVGAGMGSTLRDGSIPFLAAVCRDVVDATEVPTALVAVAVNV